MAKPPLSMQPTGWSQVAWSAEVGIGGVRRMKYFDCEMIAWRAGFGPVAVMNAYREHLGGAHPGHGGRIEDERIVCPSHGWEWNAEGRNVRIPYENRPNPGRRIRSYSVVERKKGIYIRHDYIRHDVHGRAPHSEVPDAFTGLADGATAVDYYPAFGRSTLYRERLELHSQYVLENGVGFDHFRYVHKVALAPKFTSGFRRAGVVCGLHHHLRRPLQVTGPSSATNSPTRFASSSRMGRTASISRPRGSGTSHSR